jgi:molybdopterin-guanine dinucleotide biosynthesis protein A
MHAAEIVGVALAGGRSRRLGRDKATLRTGDGRTLLESTLERLRRAAAEVVAADRGRRVLDAVPAVDDGPGAGPAAGILGAAAARPGRALLVLACDLPRVPAALLAALAATAGDWVVPEWTGDDGRPRLEPLCALYRPAALACLAAQVAAGDYALHRLAARPELAVHRFGGAALAAFGPPAALFANVNTPADLAILRR